MTLLHRLASIARWQFSRRNVERELDDELQSFIDLAAAEKIRDGASPADARRSAMIELGGVEQTKERVRTFRYGAWLDEIGRDLRYAIRASRKNPGFTAIVVFTLALGIGANTAIFSLIDALMLRWLPVPDPQELVQVRMQSPGARSANETFSYPIVRALDDQRDIFLGVAGFSGASFIVGPAGSLTKVPGAWVTGAYYETLGVKPAAGRLLARDDDVAGAPIVAAISDGYWERQFARRPDIVGQALLINGVPATIVGVSPRGFVGANVGLIADITLPAAAVPRVAPEAGALLGPGNFWMRALARPTPGLPVREAAARVATVWPHIADSVLSPRWSAARRKSFTDGVFQLTPGGTGWTNLRDDYRKPLSVLMAVVGVVLLVACANVASLLLARASARQREIAVRLAIGASRGRIIRQLLVESTLLSFVGAAFGIGLAWTSGRFLVNLISRGPFPLAFDLTPNGHVLAFTSIVAIATGIVFGVAPALQTTAVGPSPVLKDDARIGSARSRLLPALVTTQVALSLVLLIGAGLLVRTLQNLQRFDPGFNREGVLLADFEARRTAVPPELLEQVRAMPGVVSAAVSTHTPLSGSVWSEPAVPVGQPLPERDTAYFVGAGADFFRTMQIPLLAGREFTSHDTAESPGVAVVNERFVQRFLSNQTPVGAHLSASVRGQKRDLEIIAVAKNTNAAGLRAAPPPTVYVAYAQLTGDFPTTLEIRARGRLDEIAAAVRQLLQPRLPSAPVEVRALAAQVDATMAQERMMATLAGGFGVVALLLASVGLYGLLAYSVARRTKELGIRMALGAQRSRVVALVLRGAARPVVLGIALGLPAAWAASRWVESMLFGLTPSDPGAVAGAIGVLALAALAAAYVPARRAARVDPMLALRHE